MKFLFSIFSSVGHVDPFSAIATELVSRGHEIRWLCGPHFRDRISATGATLIAWSSPICDADVKPGKPYTAESTNSETLIQPTIRALEHEDCLVVGTVPTRNTEAFLARSLPANVHIERFIPHTNLLPFVDIMITNAGYNGVLAALSHGVPLVCAGISEDKTDMSALVAQCGAGINLKTDRPSEAQIRDAVKTIRNDLEYATQAKRIQDDFARHDSAMEACNLIEDLVKHNGSLSQQQSL